MRRLMFIGICELLFLKGMDGGANGWGRYFEGGASSVYMWDLDQDGFAGVVLLKKCLSPSPHPPPPTTSQLTV